VKTITTIKIKSGLKLFLLATYNGLFFEKGWWEQNAGTITIRSSARGTFSAKLQMGPERHSFSGMFGADGFVARDLPRRYGGTLHVEFGPDPEDPDVLKGTLSGGSSNAPWTADLFADRAVHDGKTSISYDLGQYTMVVYGNLDSTNSPAGHSYGTVKVNKVGKLKFAGSLADGTKVTQSAMVSKDGAWPFYASLYRGGGAAYGWIWLNSPDEEGVVQDVAGDVNWIRPAMPEARNYPGGFSILATATGSHYVRPPRGVRLLNVTNAEIQFNAGNLYGNFTNHIVLNPDNRVLNLDANRLDLRFKLSTGLIQGSVMDPLTSQWIRFQGVVMQRFGLAAGYFLGWYESGEVWLEGN
jgi:hypothetical protein